MTLMIVEDLLLLSSCACICSQPCSLHPSTTQCNPRPLWSHLVCGLLGLLSSDSHLTSTSCLSSSSLDKIFPRETEKLELPSISQVHTSGPADIPWYNNHAAERPLLSGNKLPALGLPTATQAPSRTLYSQQSQELPSSSARSSLSGASAVQEPRSPLPPPDLGTQGLDSEYSIAQQGYYPSPTSLDSMNQTQPYMDVHSHLSSAQPYASQGATAGTMSHYPYHHQPPVLHPASSYGPAPYPQYGYPNGVTSPPTGPQPPASSMSGQMPAQLLPLPGKSCEMRREST